MFRQTESFGATINFDYEHCPSYALELSDFTLFHQGNSSALINDSEVDFVDKSNDGIYTFWFVNNTTKKSEWLLESSTYVTMEGTSSTVIRLEIPEPDNTICESPILTVKDSIHFVSIIFSLVYVVCVILT